MTLPFAPEEFAARTARVRKGMERAGLDVLIVSDPANTCWLTGMEDWSFYTPQAAVVSPDDDRPIFWCRAMDAPGARRTTWMGADRCAGWPEELVHRGDAHPFDHLATTLQRHRTARIGYEGDAMHLTPRAVARLAAGLPDARLIDAGNLVNRARVAKSPAEIECMGRAARIAGGAMRAAAGAIRPGARQCDAAAAILAAQVAPDAPFGGDLTAVPPIILAGEAADTAHPAWSDAPFEDGQTVAVELGGAHRRYTAGLARTFHLGAPPRRLIDTASAVEEGLEAVLSALRAGITGAEAHAAWAAVLARHGLRKDSRIGYSIGIGFAPDWGERAVSLRPGEHEPIPEDACLHVMLGMWLDGWGMEMSETVRLTEGGIEVLTDFPRGVHVLR